MSLTVGSLFSGIGGLDAGLEQSGMKTVWQVEYDDWCRDRLEENFPHTEKYKDVKEVGKQNLESVDLICGGFPCQDISIANTNGKGLDGERSGLWFEYFRILCEMRPRYALIENVSNLLIRGFERLLLDLASIGYDAEWQVIRASFTGLLHERKRLFIVAYPQSERSFHVQVFKRIRDKKLQSPKQIRRQDMLFTSVLGRKYPQIPGNLCVDNGISYELSEIERAVKAYGNAVAVPVAKFIGEQIIRFDNEIKEKKK